MSFEDLPPPPPPDSENDEDENETITVTVNDTECETEMKVLLEEQNFVFPLEILKEYIQEDNVEAIKSKVRSKNQLQEYITDTLTIIDYATRYNALMCFDYFHILGYKATYLSMDYCSAYGNLKACMLLSEIRKIKGSVNAVDYAAKNGNTNVVIWLIESGTGTCTHNAFDYACEEGHIEIIKYLHKLYPNNKEIFANEKLYTTCALVNAVKNKHWDIINYLTIVMKIPVTNEAVSEACVHGDIDTLKFFCETLKFSVSSTEPMDQACINGYLEIIEYLREYHLCRCTRRALNYAAKNGHRQIVEFLVNEVKPFRNKKELRKLKKPIIPLFEEPEIENLRDSGNFGTNGNMTICSTMKRRYRYSLSDYSEPLALDWACEFGHMRIVKCLTEKLRAHCTNQALNKAAENGHDNIVKYIVKHFPELMITDETIKGAKSKNLRSWLVNQKKKRVI